ncbi:nitrilase-related carbon-nitrogen hydrolase [Rhodococcoides kyotonense]|uniref:Predicted amidohydrolase n=1 Tax=Rhodococcoides kyotonense TaxID=398843 RepID=A0A239MVX9_9NOCA|nr:nitrilase-related carbon-nitrogen hydrolase [Rhodococcus kyotonensis]SNT46947.1 Predicted amidohydrolase [Rhodococcus kyotonensis]
MSSVAPYEAAAIQYEPTLFAKSTNIADLLALVEEASSHGAKLITTPEMATTGYCLYDYDEAATVVETIPGPTTDSFAAVAREHGCYVVVGMPEVDTDTGLFYNAAVLIGPEGVVGTHRKTHSYIAEPKWAAPGNLGHQVFDTEIGRIALLICMDIHFLETARVVALDGADVICHISNWLAERTPAPYWISRAFENQCYVIESNRWGLERTVQFSGGTCIIEPDGTIASSIDSGNGIAYAQIDPERTRAQNFSDRRRPELYRELQSNTFLWNPLDFFSLYGHRSMPEGARTSVTVVQSTPGTDVDANLAAIEEAMVAANPDELLVFPELSISGPSSQSHAVAESLDGPSISRIVQAAARTSTTVVVGLAEFDDGSVYDTAVVVGPTGILGSYRQTHVAPSDRNVFDAGDRWTVLDLPVGRVGILLGNDVLFPEAGRVLALRGCDLIVCPAAISAPVGGHVGTTIPHPGAIATEADPLHWHHMRVRAGENNVWFAFANAYDPERGVDGHSGVFGPDTFAFPRSESVVVTETGTATAVVDTTNLDSPYPTNVVRRKDLVSMRLPHHYPSLSGAAPVTA